MSNSNGSDKKKHKAHPAPKSEWELIFQGAEARLWKLPWMVETGADATTEDSSPSQSTIVVCKERFSKAYRHPELDAKLTKSRCRSEARLLEKCHKQNGNSKGKLMSWSVPKVVNVDPPLLYLQYLKGAKPLKQVLLEQETSNNKSNVMDLKVLAQRMGDMVASLHGLGIVHGDLTTSNMMVQWNLTQKSEQADHGGNATSTPSHKRSRDERDSLEAPADDSTRDNSLFSLFLIDFGLAKATWSVEEQAVDLYVLERALLSTHPDLDESFFNHWLLPSYQATVEKHQTTGNTGNGKNKNTETALQRLEQVRKRGRKRECFG